VRILLNNKVYINKAMKTADAIIEKQKTGENWQDDLIRIGGKAFPGAA